MLKIERIKTSTRIELTAVRFNFPLEGNELVLDRLEGLGALLLLEEGHQVVGASHLKGTVILRLYPLPILRHYPVRGGSAPAGTESRAEEADE